MNRTNVNLKFRKFEEIVKKLLLWENKNYIFYPWREKVGCPHNIFIVELLLQKTNAEKVGEVYENFLAGYPTLSSILEAPKKMIEKELKPLGLQKKKSERLKKSVEIIFGKFNGKIPEKREKLKDLPGVGDYISNAILCFGFNKPRAVVDVNARRIFGRVLCGCSLRQTISSELERKIEKTVHKKDFTRFNFAILDLGKKVCTSKNPKCINCPLRSFCYYFKS